MPRSETRREVAERIVREYPGYANPIDAIEAALKDRDERAAKITADILPIGADDCYWCERVERAVAAIRNEDTE